MTSSGSFLELFESFDWYQKPFEHLVLGAVENLCSCLADSEKVVEAGIVVQKRRKLVIYLKD